MDRRRIVVMMGTRPEAIKLAPVVRELRRREDVFDSLIATTSQHSELLSHAMKDFGLTADIDLGLMRHGQGLEEFLARALPPVADLLVETRPDAVLVQGDTITVLATALACFYRGVPVGHVEAGLRSHDPENPFPEEVNRRMTACVADWHFAPTERAKNNLLTEAIRSDAIFVTGNTVVDAINSYTIPAAFQSRELDHLQLDGRRMILVTAHRRENHGKPLHGICAAIRTLAERFDDVEIVFPVHPNPKVREVVYPDLENRPRIHLIEPLHYGDMLRAMSLCHFVLTDSGGLQEEAPTLHRPVLVLRDTTERPELIEAGGGVLVGTNCKRIVAEATRLLQDRAVYESMTRIPNPFGDGRASERIADVLAHDLNPENTSTRVSHAEWRVRATT